MLSYQQPEKIENAFSGKDELMGNLKAAAIACGVVASVLGGGAGVAYITSSTISTADLVTEENASVYNSAAGTSTSATADEAERATANKGTTTKKSNNADKSSATSKYTRSAQEGTTSQYSTAADKAAKISKSVPAPAHAPGAITQPATQPATTATMIASAADVIRETTTAILAELTSTTTQSATTTTEVTTTAEVTTTTTETTTTVVETVTEAPTVTTETYVEPATEPQTTDVQVTDGSLTISEEDYILLCNAVGHEAGSNTISDYNKALVVEVLMNRVASPMFPNTIYDVLTQAGQFTGAWSYVGLGTFSSKVTQSVKDAVTLYFSEPESFTQGYLFFTGNGRENIFRTTY